MRPDLVSLLRCPVCADGLALIARTARCPRGHAFDLAKQGYLNLLPSASTGIEGDSAAMIDARAAFLAGGHYAPIRDALIAHTPPEATHFAEVGAGTAYYLAGVIAEPDAAGERVGIALDVSRYAARRAAKVDERIGSVVCDAWKALPLRDGVAEVLLDVFAPRNAPEMRRVLAPGGTLLVVTPNQAHLAELIAVLGMVRVDEDKDRRLRDSLASHFVQTAATAVDVGMRLDHRSVRQLVEMTPSARHLRPEELTERIAVLADPVEVTLSVTLSVWQAS
ncbi:23S rRNA m(1)G-748 methyltransferase [Kribbella voronezhensis]|uniref:23S rRNA m(1)G-748 methyltransferase n=1 Tax=Kribbella voronezhensis TaxID=2512212 RepID=A0A4R7T4D5_9ACTN|nr:methyltransferase type 11 [Kribbella voronezhensis]TDU86684.1 23S rRNA m(1)G-748 methyltransferase [Kribbella voronezhensis]